MKSVARAPGRERLVALPDAFNASPPTRPNAPSAPSTAASIRHGAVSPEASCAFALRLATDRPPGSERELRAPGAAEAQREFRLLRRKILAQYPGRGEVEAVGM